MNTGSPSFTFCCFAGRRSEPAATARWRPAASSRCAARSTSGPVPAIVNVSTHTTAARIAARRAGEAEPLLGLLLGARRSPSRSTAAPTRLGARSRPALDVRLGPRSRRASRRLARRVDVDGFRRDFRGRPLAAPARPVGTSGTVVSDRAASRQTSGPDYRSTSDHVTCPRPRSAGTPGRPRSGRRRRAPPRCAAAGCTWRPARCGPARRS